MSISSFASFYNGSYSASARVAQGLNAGRLPDETLSEQLRAALGQQSGNLPVGTTITASYQYRVGPDGALYPTQTQITTESNEVESSATDADGRKQRRSLMQQEDSREQSLRNVQPVKPQLSPTDEVALFADAQLAVAAQPVTGEAVDATGIAVNVTILPPGVSDQAAVSRAEVLTISQRNQAGVAGLYARNSDISYSVYPLASIAA